MDRVCSRPEGGLPPKPATRLAALQAQVEAQQAALAALQTQMAALLAAREPAPAQPSAQRWVARALGDSPTAADAGREAPAPGRQTSRRGLLKRISGFAGEVS